jgi:hypothetical protein
MRLKYVVLAAAVAVAALNLTTALCSAADTSKNPMEDPDSEIHIHTRADAKALRQRIIKYFWADGKLPLKELPSVSAVPLTPELERTLETRVPERWVKSPSEPIIPGLVGRVEKLVVNVDFDYHSTAYLLYPTNAVDSARLLIIHQGHQGGVMDGIGDLANRALAEGFQVLLMQMPMAGWNTDNVLNLHTGKVTIVNRGSIIDDHTRLVAAVEGQGGSALRFFVEPAIVCVNYFVRQNPKHGIIAMAGLSGGGWTTDLVPAIDTRISVSIPVAGSCPWYCQRPVPPGTPRGDGEQSLPAMWEKTASYLDVYILAGYGEGRKRIQVLCEFDSLCIAAVAGSKTYKRALSRVMKALGAGESDVVVDRNEQNHRISKWAIENVIMPAILPTDQGKKAGSATSGESERQ